MSKSAIKFYVVPGFIALLFVAILLLVPLNNKKSEDNISPTPTVVFILPTKSLVPNGNPPTLIPPQKFTGADINQEIPLDLKVIGEQKTALRRLIPLTLPFGIIDFNYEDDVFIVRFNELNDQNQQLFTTWREEKYPALTQDKFAF